MKSQLPPSREQTRPQPDDKKEATDFGQKKWITCAWIKPYLKIPQLTDRFGGKQGEVLIIYKTLFVLL